MARSLVRELVSGAAVLALVACASPDGEPADGETTAVQRSAIFGGTASPSSEDYVVKSYGSGGISVPPSCTGVLVAPTLILTARHCVTAGLLNNSAKQCILGTQVYPKEMFTVYVGAALAQSRQFKVKRVVIDFDSDACENDIAGLELTEAVPGITFPPMELDTLPKVNDQVSLVGWGRASDDVAGDPDIRQRGTGSVLGLNAATYKNAAGDNLVVRDDGFVVTSINPCEGDSGSPLFDSRGAVVGVTSAGLFPSTDTTEGTSCANGISLIVPLARHTDFVERLFQSIGKMPPRAGRAVPADLGGLCESAKDCNSNYCVGVGPRSMCSRACAADTDCGGALVCTDTGNGASVCLDATTPPSADASCSVASPGEPRPVSNVGVFAVAVAAISLFGRTIGERRRRH